MDIIKRIQAMDTPTITPAIAAEALGCDPQYIRLQAHADPSKLGFPVVCIGKRTKIPRMPFLAFMLGEISERSENDVGS